MEDCGRQYQVVVNHEEQYSIWPSDKPLPNGWRLIGFESIRERCLEHIRELWTDMRPLSLRARMRKAATPKTGTPE
jgi:MbtH protein